MGNKLIVLTGPAGVGKSTTAKIMAKGLEKSAYISGDRISHMSVAGREMPWESRDAHNLVMKNIKDLSTNFLNYGCDVIVDWIIFWDDIEDHIKTFADHDVEVRYAVIWAEEDVHVERDRQRPVEAQMGERVLILRNEFMESGVPENHYIDNTNLEIDEVINMILTDDKYIVAN